MEAIHRSGRAKTIGVSNFQQNHLEAILKTATIKPAINQIEFHPYLQQGRLLAFMKKHNIAVSGYGPQTPITKVKNGPVTPALQALAKKYDVSEGVIALRWCLDLGVIAITTSLKESRLQEYLKVGQFQLTPTEVDKICEEGAKMHFRGFFKANFPDEEDRAKGDNTLEHIR
jgi:diketogulonate reductase-like aldo/keto reductase